MGHAKKTELKKERKHTNNNIKGACDCVCLCVGQWVSVGVWFRVSGVVCCRVGVWVSGCFFMFPVCLCFLDFFKSLKSFKSLKR